MFFLQIFFGIVIVMSWVILTLIKRIDPFIMKTIRPALAILILVLLGCQANCPGYDNLSLLMMFLLYLNVLTVSSVLIHNQPKLLTALTAILIILCSLFGILVELSFIVFSGISCGVGPGVGPT